MQLTKGAIGNLINRYKAVLKKCHLLNVFGSLAVAGMLVMGGAATAGAADPSVAPKSLLSYTGTELLENTAAVSTEEGAEFDYQLADGTITITATKQTSGGRSVLTNLYNDGTVERISTSGLSITGSSFVDNKSDTAGFGGGAITLWGDGGTGTEALTHSVTDTTFSQNSADLGGAVAIMKQNDFAVAGNTTFMDDTFTGNNAVNGGAIYAENENITVSGKNSFKENTASQNGGAIYILKGSTLTVEEGTTFSKNTATMNGGAIAGTWGDNSSLTVTGSYFTENTARSSGGAIALWNPATDATYTVSNTTFDGNTATKKGGAIAILSETGIGGQVFKKAEATFNGDTFTGNTAGESGGALHLEYANVTITDSTFTANEAGKQGGAIYNAADSSITFNGTNTFSGNMAEGANGWGGAIYNAGTLTVNGGEFTGNEAGKYGGAIAGDVEGQGSLNITNATFTGNTSGAGGAIALWSDGIKDAASHSIAARFEGNTAERKGGAIAFLTNHSGDKTVTASISGEFLNNSAGESGGAIHSERGTLTITDATFSGNSAEQQGGAIYNDANSSITFKGTNTFSGNTAAEGKDIYNAGSLTMSSGSDLVVYGSGSILNAAGGNINVENGARLTIADAVSGGTYTVVSGEGDIRFNGGDYNAAGSTGWKGENLQASSDMFILTSTDGMTFTAQGQDAHTVFPNLSDGMANAVNDLYTGHAGAAGQPNWDYADVNSDQMGVRFLSRATDNRFLGSDKDAAASTIESAARIAFAGAVPQMTKMASDAGSNAVVNRLGFANPADGAQAMNAEGKIVDRNTTGFALWIAPLWQSQHGWGMEADNLDYGFNGNLGGVSLGADYTFENAIRAGITFNIGGGYAESSGGDLNSTENRMSFWGLGAYAGWNYENFGLMADVSYTSTWNDLKQDMDSRMGMGDLEADVQASAISAGLRAEYKLETSVLDVIPHIGVRYMSLNTWGFDAESNGGTVLEGDGFHQDIWTFPVGVTFTKDFTLDSGWSFKPSIDFSVIPAAGDIKAKQDVAFTGLPGSYEVETQMMDYLTWQGGVGLEMGNDTMSFGVNYTLQAGQHTTGHGVFGSFRYEF